MDREKLYVNIVCGSNLITIISKILGRIHIKAVLIGQVLHIQWDIFLPAIHVYIHDGWSYMAAVHTLCLRIYAQSHVVPAWLLQAVPDHSLHNQTLVLCNTQSGGSWKLLRCMECSICTCHDTQSTPKIQDYNNSTKMATSYNRCDKKVHVRGRK